MEIDYFVNLYLPLVTIFFANPYDLNQLDMNDINSSIWFLSDTNIKKGVMYETKGDLKREAIKFCLTNPGRCWKGMKGEQIYD